jgi:hypothetical protein
MFPVGQSTDESWIRQDKKPGPKDAPPGVIRETFKEFVKALFVFIVLHTGHAYLLSTPAGSHLKEFESALLQDALHGQWYSGEKPTDPSTLPLIIDVSRWKDQDRTLPTNRILLASIIDILEEEHHRATAIGIDLEFASLERTPDPEDRTYLEEWSEYGNVRVGVYGRALLGRDRWLGWSRFSDMAAGIALPSEFDRAFLYTWARRAPGPGEGSTEAPRLEKIDSRRECLNTGDCLLELPSALWNLSRKQSQKSGIDHLEVKQTEATGKDLVFGEYQIDYSYLPRIERDSIVLSPPARGLLAQPNPRKAIKDQVRQDIGNVNAVGRIVLIGDLADVRDQFCAVVRDRPLPGIFMHASAIATLTHGLFLEADEAWTLRIEITLMVLIGIGIALIKKIHGVSAWRYEYIEILAYAVLSVIVLIFSTLLIRASGVYWRGFLWVSAALFIHPLITNPLCAMAFAGIDGARTFLKTFASPDKRHANH